MHLTLISASALNVDLMINKIVLDVTKNNGINISKSALMRNAHHIRYKKAKELDNKLNATFAINYRSTKLHIHA